MMQPLVVIGSLFLVLFLTFAIAYSVIDDINTYYVIDIRILHGTDINSTLGNKLNELDGKVISVVPMDIDPESTTYQVVYCK